MTMEKVGLRCKFATEAQSMRCDANRCINLHLKVMKKLLLPFVRGVCPAVVGWFYSDKAMYTSNGALKARKALERLPKSITAKIWM